MKSLGRQQEIISNGIIVSRGALNLFHVKQYNMDELIEMSIGGHRAMVRPEHVKIFLKKQSLVNESLTLQKLVNSNPTNKVLAYDLGRTMGKIINLNRKMNREGIFWTPA